jgi:hypothetical protein
VGHGGGITFPIYFLNAKSTVDSGTVETMVPLGTRARFKRSDVQASEASEASDLAPFITSNLPVLVAVTTVNVSSANSFSFVSQHIPIRAVIILCMGRMHHHSFRTASICVKTFVSCALSSCVWGACQAKSIEACVTLINKSASSLERIQATYRESPCPGSGGVSLIVLHPSK